MTKRLAMLSLMIWMALGVNAATAAAGPECDMFEYQEHAQEALDQVAENFPSLLSIYQENLDPDRDGVACPELPEVPKVLAAAFDIRGGFELSPFTALEEPVISGLGYSARYDVNLAGVSYSAPRGTDCDELLSAANLNSAINETGTVASLYYITLANGESPPPDEDDQRHEITGLAWTIEGNPDEPVLVNEWLLSQGLGTLDKQTVPDDLKNEFEEAEAAAREQSLGIWGSSTVPVSLKDAGAGVAGAYDHFLRESGAGDQVHSFTVETEGVYQLTLDAMSGPAVFVALDVYSADGSWLPELSVTTAESGAYTSAGHLAPGDYYFQIKAVGSWRVTIDPL